MAVLWSRSRSGKRVEVRSAGRTRRLYVDGVLHTAYHPGRPLTGDVWDQLVVAGLLAPPGTIDRVLLLGLGGGAAVHLLRRLVGPREIVAVELDAERIELARRFFDVGGPGLRLVQADARRWLHRCRQRFALIIDDLFSELRGQPQRSVALDEAWIGSLLGHLTEPGWLVVNTADSRELLDSPLVQCSSVRQRFPAALRFSSALQHNAIGAFCGCPGDARALRRKLRAHPALQSARLQRMLRFRVHTLWS